MRIIISWLGSIVRALLDQGGRHGYMWEGWVVFSVKVSLGQDSHLKPTVWPQEYKPHCLNPCCPPMLLPAYLYVYTYAPMYIHLCTYLLLGSNLILWSVVGIMVYSPT